jgi:hypothetical protein
MKKSQVLGVPCPVLYICNPSTREAEAEGIQVGGQHGIYNETLSKKKPLKNKINK